MSILKRFWAKLGEEKFSTLIINLIATFLALYLVLFDQIPSPYVWAIGFLNGAAWFVYYYAEDDDD